MRASSVHLHSLGFGEITQPALQVCFFTHFPGVGNRFEEVEYSGLPGRDGTVRYVRDRSLIDVAQLILVAVDIVAAVCAEVNEFSGRETMTSVRPLPPAVTRPLPSAVAICRRRLHQIIGWERLTTFPALSWRSP